MHKKLALLAMLSFLPACATPSLTFGTQTKAQTTKSKTKAKSPTKATSSWFPAWQYDQWPLLQTRRQSFFK